MQGFDTAHHWTLVTADPKLESINVYYKPWLANL